MLVAAAVEVVAEMSEDDILVALDAIQVAGTSSADPCDRDLNLQTAVDRLDL